MIESKQAMDGYDDGDMVDSFFFFPPPCGQACQGANKPGVSSALPCLADAGRSPPKRSVTFIGIGRAPSASTLLFPIQYSSRVSRRIRSIFRTRAYQRDLSSASSLRYLRGVESKLELMYSGLSAAID